MLNYKHLLLALSGGLIIIAIFADESAHAQSIVTGSSPVAVGPYEIIPQQGFWLLDTATGDTWKWDCPPGQSRPSQLFDLCNVGSGWVRTSWPQT